MIRVTHNGSFERSVLAFDHSVRSRVRRCSSSPMTTCSTSTGNRVDSIQESELATTLSFPVVNLMLVVNCAMNERWFTWLVEALSDHCIKAYINGLWSVITSKLLGVLKFLLQNGTHCKVRSIKNYTGLSIFKRVNEESGIGEIVFNLIESCLALRSPLNIPFIIFFRMSL